MTGIEKSRENTPESSFGISPDNNIIEDQKPHYIEVPFRFVFDEDAIDLTIKNALYMGGGNYVLDRVDYGGYSRNEHGYMTENFGKIVLVRKDQVA